MNGHAKATARANIALAKYWGKSDEALNLPAVPSISVTLDALVTETEVTVQGALAEDALVLGGREVLGAELAKTTAFLDRVRAKAGTQARARVVSENHFPSASGLASSASGFAALAAAASRAYGLSLTDTELSALARRGSASAARSIHGGFVELPAGAIGDDALAARPLHPADHWDVCVVIAVATLASKKTASRDGMRTTARTSPYYPAWVEHAPRWCDRVREGIAARDLEAVGRAMEASTFAFHASAWAADPPVRYVRAITMSLLDRVEDLRRDGVPAWATMDAGPHVKVLCAGSDATEVAAALGEVAGVVEVKVARPGAGVSVA